MALRGAAAWLGDYLRSLAATVVFPLVWLQSLRIAKEHADADKRSVPKVALGVLLSVALAGGGAFMLIGFHDAQIDGAYDSLDTRIARYTGESAYRDAVDLASGGDSDAAATAAKLEPNHALYEAVAARLALRDDAGAKALIAGRGTVEHPDEDKDMDALTADAFTIKDKAVADVDTTMLWVVYPSLVGVFFAPLVFSVGSVLKRSFMASKTVGYKPYPAGAAAVFLLLGGLGVPALFFAAWVFKDMTGRAAEGQIEL